MNLTLKRIIAYLIDLTILFLLLTMLSSVVIKNTEAQNLSQNLLVETQALLKDPECSECITNMNNLIYKISKANVINDITGISLYLIYFVVLPPFTSGQTIGKKLMKIKLLSKKGSKLSIFQTIIRSALLYGIAVNVVTVIVLISASQAKYLRANQFLTYLQFTIFLICFIGIFRKDGVSFHDFLAGTKVVPEELETSAMMDSWVNADQESIQKAQQIKRKHTQKKEGNKNNE